MPLPDFSSVSPQFPLNTSGTFGPNGIYTYGRFYTASGGTVGLGQVSPSGVATGIKNAGPQGWPGMGATLVGTGRYNVIHPPATIVALDGNVASPSGVIPHTIKQVRGLPSGTILPATGITQIEVWSTPTGGTQLTNPPTGTRFDLRLYVAPTNVGFAQF